MSRNDFDPFLRPENGEETRSPQQREIARRDPDDPPPKLPEKIIARICVIVAVLAQCKPDEIRVALQPRPTSRNGGYMAIVMRGGTDVRNALGTDDNGALEALETLVIADAQKHQTALLDLLDAYYNRPRGPVHYTVVTEDKP